MERVDDIIYILANEIPSNECAIDCLFNKKEISVIRNNFPKAVDKLSAHFVMPTFSCPLRYERKDQV